MTSTNERSGMANPVVHFEVVGKDAATLMKFYGDAFGWQLQDVMDGSYYMANTGGEGDIPGGIGAAPDGGSGHVMFYVQVDDPAVALEKIKSLGGRTVSEPMGVPDEPTMPDVAGPDG